MSARDEVMAALRIAPVSFATLAAPAGGNAPAQRRVVVTGPPVVLDLLAAPTVELLEAVADALRDATTAWSAEILLASLTGHQAQIVDAFARSPDMWLATQREQAVDTWSVWIATRKASLQWSERERRYTWSEP